MLTGLILDTSNYLVAFVGGYEGKVLKAYLDPVHVLTIGYGFTWKSAVFRKWWLAHHNAKLKLGDTMTESEALEVLLLILQDEGIDPVAEKFPGQTQTLIAAGASMVYNCGEGALAWQWATDIANGHTEEGIARWRTTGTTAKGKKLPGLVRRRNEEADVASTGKWPAWVRPWVKGLPVPETYSPSENIAQAQRWLEELGYNPGPADGVPGLRTRAAVTRFQSEHGQLTVDGIIGPATLAALRRTIDARKAGGVVVTGTGGSVIVGTTGDGIAPKGEYSWIGDLLVWGGLAVGIGILIWLIWRYKDELVPVLRKVA